MNIGRLRHRVTLERLENRRDGVGGSLDLWNPLATVWANVAAISGREMFRGAAGVATEATHRVEIRHFPGLRTEDRIRFETRKFRIVHINDAGGRGERDEILCLEEVAS